MIERRTRCRLLSAMTLALLVAAGGAAAQQSGTAGAVPPVEGDIDARALDARDRRMLARICWERGEPRGADWMADQNPAYRGSVFSRYVQETTGFGWRWLPAESVRAGDLRADLGYTDRLLEVHALGEKVSWARLEVTGPLREGTARFEWRAPPERVCMLDELQLRAEASIAAGDPGEQRISFLLPLSPELLQVSGATVKACSPGAFVGVDGEHGPARDGGECSRSLLHLEQGATWSVWVSLPESFYVVYPYVPAR